MSFIRLVEKQSSNIQLNNFRERYGGIKPPVLRSEMDFDPASKFHIPANIPYLR